MAIKELITASVGSISSHELLSEVVISKWARSLNKIKLKMVSWTHLSTYQQCIRELLMFIQSTARDSLSSIKNCYWHFFPNKSSTESLAKHKILLACSCSIERLDQKMQSIAKLLASELQQIQKNALHSWFLWNPGEFFPNYIPFNVVK